MKKDKIRKINYTDIVDSDSALKIYKEMKQEYLELRLSSRQNEEVIKDYASKKKVIKKNIARALTYISGALVKE